MLVLVLSLCIQHNYIQQNCLMEQQALRNLNNRTVCIRLHQCRKTTVSSCHRCLISNGVKNELHLIIDLNVDHQMFLSKSKCWFSNNCLHYLKCIYSYLETSGGQSLYLYLNVHFFNTSVN